MAEAEAGRSSKAGAGSGPGFSASGTPYAYMFSPQLGLGSWGDSAELSFNYSEEDGQQSFNLLSSQPNRSLEMQDLMQSVQNKKQKISPTIDTSNYTDSNFQFLESNEPIEQQVEIETSNEVEPTASALVDIAHIFYITIVMISTLGKVSIIKCVLFVENSTKPEPPPLCL